jgi:hypothetical protein
MTPFRLGSAKVDQSRLLRPEREPSNASSLAIPVKILHPSDSQSQLANTELIKSTEIQDIAAKYYPFAEGTASASALLAANNELQELIAKYPDSKYSILVNMPKELLGPFKQELLADYLSSRPRVDDQLKKILLKIPESGELYLKDIREELALSPDLKKFDLSDLATQVILINNPDQMEQLSGIISSLEAPQQIQSLCTGFSNSPEPENFYFLMGLADTNPKFAFAAKLLPSILERMHLLRNRLVYAKAKVGAIEYDIPRNPADLDALAKYLAEEEPKLISALTERNIPLPQLGPLTDLTPSNKTPSPSPWRIIQTGP